MEGIVRKLVNLFIIHYYCILYCIKSMFIFIKAKVLLLFLPLLSVLFYREHFSLAQFLSTNGFFYV